MDFYGTATTAVTQIYQVTVFIQGVVSDIKAFEQDKHDLHLKLELQLASLQFFQERFLDPQHGLLLLPGKVPERIQVAIKNLLEKMKSVLSEYEVLVHRYNVLSEEEESPVNKDEVEREKWRKKFFEKAKTKAKSLKLKGYDWSLFDREKLIAVVEEYKQWADSLRGLMQHFNQEAVYSISDAMSAMSLKGTGLEPVVKRQKLASASAPESFQALDGDLVDAGTQSDNFQIAWWKYGSEEQQQVIVEYHEYDSRLKVEDLDSEEIEELKEPVRDLAWLLQNSTFSEDDGPVEDSGQPTIYALQCLGFIDQPEWERSAFIYKLPLATSDETANLITLHGLINKLDPATKRPLGKLPLGDRFNIAHCLALTVLNVHGSRWVHKNIWSRGILLFEQGGDRGLRPLFSSKRQATDAENSTTKAQILAFLGDWGYARLEQAGTKLRVDFEIEPNFYRHPERQQKPDHQFSSQHDNYALGVVLLEIGLWKTISQLFAKPIQDAQKSGRPPKAKDVRAALVSLAQTELPKEMGESYALAVSSCLLGKFKGDSDAELSLDFKETVVDAIAQGRKL